MWDTSWCQYVLRDKETSLWDPLCDGSTKKGFCRDNEIRRGPWGISGKVLSRKWTMNPTINGMIALSAKMWLIDYSHTYSSSSIHGNHIKKDTVKQNIFSHRRKVKIGAAFLSKDSASNKSQISSTMCHKSNDINYSHCNLNHKQWCLFLKMSRHHKIRNGIRQMNGNSFELSFCR